MQNILHLEHLLALLREDQKSFKKQVNTQQLSTSISEISNFDDFATPLKLGSKRKNKFMSEQNSVFEDETP